MEVEDYALVALLGWTALFLALLAPWDMWWNRRRLFWRELKRNLSKKEN